MKLFNCFSYQRTCYFQDFSFLYDNPYSEFYDVMYITNYSSNKERKKYQIQSFKTVFFFLLCFWMEKHMGWKRSGSICNSMFLDEFRVCNSRWNDYGWFLFLLTLIFSDFQKILYVNQCTICTDRFVNLNETMYIFRWFL